MPVPRHWCFKRKYLQGKKGIEKPPFDLPDFINKTFFNRDPALPGRMAWWAGLSLLRALGPWPRRLGPVLLLQRHRVALAFGLASTLLAGSGLAAVECSTERGQEGAPQECQGHGQVRE